MGFFLTLAILALLLVAAELVLSPPSWLARLAASARRRLSGNDDQPELASLGADLGENAVTTVEWGLFPRQFIQHRLQALAAELDLLDRDPDVFARAFHTIAARSAYDALLDDAARLSAPPPARAGSRLSVGGLSPSSTGSREELEL